MRTIVYLANLQVQVIVGTANKMNISVKESYTFDAPEGSIINGMIMDVDAFTEFLKDVWAQNRLPKKNVTLVINSSKFIGKTIEMPAINDAKTFSFIEREYAGMGRDEEFCFSFIPVKKLEGKQKKVYAEGISPEFIKDYIDLFEAADIKLSAIYSGESSLITYTSQTLAKEYKNFVLLVADSITLTTILWIDGAFYYYNMARCFHEQGTPEYASDIARSISQLSQFMKANQIEATLECIQIAGVEREDEGMYKTAIMDIGVDTPIKIYSQSGNKSGYLNAISGFYSAAKTQNFLIQYNQTGKKKKAEKNAGLVRNIVAISSIFIVMMAILVACIVVRNSKKKELDALTAINEDPMRMFDLMEYDRYVDRNNYLNSQYKAIDSLNQNIATYPTGNSNVLMVFDRCAQGYATVTHDSFDAISGVISMTAKASNVEDINKFIKNLTQESMFSTVDYTGYRYDESLGLWDVHVNCTLAEAAGR